MKGKTILVTGGSGGIGLKRAGELKEVAKTVMFAATCRYFTAAEINLDGGSHNR